MKNITVSVDDDVYRKARIKAAERETSVSSLVSDFLRSLSAEESEFEISKRRMNDLFSKIHGEVGELVSRDALYDRK